MKRVGTPHYQAELKVETRIHSHSGMYKKYSVWPKNFNMSLTPRKFHSLTKNAKIITSVEEVKKASFIYFADNEKGIGNCVLLFPLYPLRSVTLKKHHSIKI